MDLKGKNTIFVPGLTSKCSQQSNSNYRRASQGFPATFNRSGEEIMNISARNIFNGTISSVITGAVNAEVTLALEDGTPITSVVTIGAAERHGLR